MAQYTVITVGDPLIISDGVDSFRYTITGTDLYLQQNVDSAWEDIESYVGIDITDSSTILDADGAVRINADGSARLSSTVVAYDGGSIWRVGVRSLEWVIDRTRTEAGFSGVENIDWDNVEGHKLP